MKQAFIIILATIGSLTSYACKCYHARFTEEVSQVDQIFIGTVLKKTSTDKAYYLFSISQIFKGDKADTLTIKTNFGGPDCGMEFEIGKTYIVYSNNKQTSRCRRNSLANQKSDLGKLKFLFQKEFSGDLGKTTSSALTDNEAEYFNSELFAERKNLDFHGKKVAFVLSGSFINKQLYFKNWGGKDVPNILLVLTEEEKKKSHSYDAIIISWSKKTVSNGFRKRLIKRLP